MGEGYRGMTDEELRDTGAYRIIDKFDWRCGNDFSY